MTKAKSNRKKTLADACNTIARLEQENVKLKVDYGCLEDAHNVLNELYEKLEKENERLTISYETLKLHDEEEIGMLKSENAELKGIKDVATLIRANNDTVVTLMQLNNMLVSERQQLTKAKVALRNVIDYLGQFCSDYPDCVIEAEKILKEE